MESKNSIKAILRDRLTELSMLEDGYAPGCHKMTDICKNFGVAIIDSFSENELDGWWIGLFQNGSILFSYDRNGIMSCVNIAEVGVSCFIDGEDSYYDTLEENVHSSEDVVKVFGKIIETISKL